MHYALGKWNYGKRTAIFRDIIQYNLSITPMRGTRHCSWGVLLWNRAETKFQPRAVFQAEVYAIKACAVENLDRNYKNRNIYILSRQSSSN
jgi:hypothetical protein